MLAGASGGLSAWLIKAALDWKYNGKNRDPKNKYKTAYDYST